MINSLACKDGLLAMRKLCCLSSFALLLLLLLPATAAAYIDPGAGSILLQGVLGAIAIAATVVAGYWRSLRRFIARAAGGRRRGDG